MESLWSLSFLFMAAVVAAGQAATDKRSQITCIEFPGFLGAIPAARSLPILGQSISALDNILGETGVSVLHAFVKVTEGPVGERSAAADFQVYIVPSGSTEPSIRPGGLPYSKFLLVPCKQVPLYQVLTQAWGSATFLEGTPFAEQMLPNGLRHGNVTISVQVVVKFQEEEEEEDDNDPQFKLYYINGTATAADQGGPAEACVNVNTAFKSKANRALESANEASVAQAGCVVYVAVIASAVFALY